MLLLLAVLAILYFTVGLRVGYLTISPMYLFNATGTNTYHFATLEDEQRVGVKGTCSVNSGSAVVSILDTTGGIVNSLSCSKKGTFALDLMAGGRTGEYTVKVDFQSYSGSLELNEQRAGAR